MSHPEIRLEIEAYGTVTPPDTPLIVVEATVNHDRMRTGQQYRLADTEDVRRRIERGFLRYVGPDERAPDGRPAD